LYQRDVPSFVLDLGENEKRRYGVLKGFKQLFHRVFYVNILEVLNRGDKTQGESVKSSPKRDMG